MPVSPVSGGGGAAASPARFQGGGRVLGGAGVSYSAEEWEDYRSVCAVAAAASYISRWRTRAWRSRGECCCL